VTEKESLSVHLIKHATDAAETAYEKIVRDGNKKRGSLNRDEVVERIRGATLSSIWETLRQMKPAGLLKIDVEEARQAIEKLVLGEAKK
jgi:hypothetical protein